MLLDKAPANQLQSK